MKLIRTLAPAAALAFAAGLYAQTAPPGGPTTGGTTPPPVAPGAGGKVPASRPMVIFPTDPPKTTPTTVAIPAPLYQTPEVARAISLNDRQVEQLNALTNQIQTRFQDQFSRLATLPEAERTDRTLALNRDYMAAWQAAARDVFDARQLARYQQLEFQAGGFTTFTDPTIQKQFNLTDAQRAALNDSIGWSNLQMQLIAQQAATDRERGLQLYGDYYKTYQQRLNEFLTADQMRNWQQLTGDPFMIPPTFPTAPAGTGPGTVTGPGGAPVPRPGPGAPGPTTGGPAPKGGPTTGGTAPPGGPTSGGTAPPGGPTSGGTVPGKGPGPVPPKM